MTVRLNRDEQEAIQNPASAKVLVLAQKKEITTHKKSIVHLQDESEGWRVKYNQSEIVRHVLKAKGDIYFFIEVVKYLLSVVLTTWGFTIYDKHPKRGLAMIFGSAVFYIALTAYEKRRLTQKGKIEE